MENEEKKENKKTNEHEIEIKIEGKEWSDALDKTFKKKQKNAQVDGFRKGKVPKNIYLKKYGIESLYLDAADLIVQQAYLKALDESQLEPVVQPGVDIKDINEESVTFTFKIITKPELKIKNYKGLNIQKEEAIVEESEINEEIENLLEDYTEVVTKDGEIAEGNIAVIDYKGFKDEEAFEGGEGENYQLEIGSNTFIPGFEESIIGMKAGEEKDINLTFPEEYHAEDLAGKDVVFHVKVNEVKEIIKRELDEDFFEDLGRDGVTNEESLRKDIESHIREYKEQELEYEYIDTLLEEVSKNVEVDIPEAMVQEEIEMMIRRIEKNFSLQGLSLDFYYKITNSNKEDLMHQFEPAAYQNILYRLMLEELKDIEKIEITKEDIDKEIDKITKEYDITRDEVLKEIGGEDAMKYELEIRGVIEKLKEYNK